MNLEYFYTIMINLPPRPIQGITSRNFTLTVVVHKLHETKYESLNTSGFSLTEI